MLRYGDVRPSQGSFFAALVFAQGIVLATIFAFFAQGMKFSAIFAQGMNFSALSGQVSGPLVFAQGIVFLNRL